MKNKKAVISQFALVITLFASLLMIAQFSGVLDIASLVGFGENVYVANWGTIECEKSPHISTYEKYLDQQK